MKKIETKNALTPITPVTKVGSAYGLSSKNLIPPNTDGYCFSGWTSAPPFQESEIINMIENRKARIPIRGPRKMPKLLANAK